jgi:hypothetical protein
MYELQRKDESYRLSFLPKMARYSCQYGKGYCYVGSIFRRKMIGAKGKFTWHYAFLYGVSKDGELLLIENNQHGVQAVSWDDFMAGLHYWEPVHIEHSSERLDEIIKRANELAPVAGEDDAINGEQFINYAVFGKRENFPAQTISEIINLLLPLFEERPSRGPRIDDHKLLDNFTRIRSCVKSERAYELEIFINENRRK